MTHPFIVTAETHSPEQRTADPEAGRRVSKRRAAFVNFHGKILPQKQKKKTTLDGVDDPVDNFLPSTITRKQQTLLTIGANIF